MLDTIPGRAQGFQEMLFRPRRLFWLTARGVLWVMIALRAPLVNLAAGEMPTDGNSAGEPVTLIRTRSPGAIAFSPDGKTIATGGYLISLNDFGTGQNLSLTKPDFDKAERCGTLAFSPDGKTLAALYNGGIKWRTDSILLWDVTEERKLAERRVLLTRERGNGDLPNTVYHLAFSPDGKTLICGGADGTTYLWDVPTGQERLHFKGGVTAAFSRQGSSLICVGHDGIIRHRQAASGDPISGPKVPARKDFIYVVKAAFASDGQKLALSDGYTLCVKDIESGAALQRLDFQGYSVSSLVFSPDSTILAVRTENIIRFVDATNGSERCWWKTPDEEGWDVAFSPDGRFICWGEKDSLRIRDLASFMKSRDKPVRGPLTEPEDAPLSAQITAHREAFEFRLGEFTPEGFSDLIASGQRPADGEVKLTFKLKNCSNQKLTLHDPDQELSSLYLFGPGAINLPERSVPVLRVFGNGASTPPPPKIVTLAPGESYSFPVTKTQLNAQKVEFYRYWLMPGEYTIRAAYSCFVSPAPKGAPRLDDGRGYVSIWSSPLQIKVVQSEK